MLRGQCLCGRVCFEVSGAVPRMYQCHCSLCRKQSGAAASAATIVPTGSFRWVQGQDGISSWIKDTGFRSDFCSTCGTPVPNPLRTLPYVWVPVGLLDDDERLAIGMQVFVDSKASWDVGPWPGVAHEGCPELLEFIAILHRGVLA